MRDSCGAIFNIQTFCVHDGPGIRTTVFLKGCPLHCYWCANPESISPEPELGVIRTRCNKCTKCLEVCPQQAITFDETDTIQIERTRCDTCGKCVEVCPEEALNTYGQVTGVEKVFEKVCRDERFYRGSGGGVTVSGGEPLAQALFVSALFKLCHEREIHTCLETSGYASSKVLKSTLRFTDYVLFDIKHMDPEIHRKYTGHSNELILRNAEAVIQTGVPTLFRLPLVPGVNDSLDNITRTAQFVKGLGDNLAIELLPYHRLGSGKYQALDRHYRMEETKPPTLEQVEHVRETIEKHGVRCSVSK